MLRNGLFKTTGFATNNGVRTVFSCLRLAARRISGDSGAFLAAFTAF